MHLSNPLRAVRVAGVALVALLLIAGAALATGPAEDHGAAAGSPSASPGEAGVRAGDPGGTVVKEAAASPAETSEVAEPAEVETEEPAEVETETEEQADDDAAATPGTPAQAGTADQRGWGRIGLPAPVQGALRVAALAAIIALGVGGALFAGQLASLLREVRIGASPSPPTVNVTSPSSSATPTPTSSPPPSPTPARTWRPTVVTQPTPPVTFETPGASAEASGSPGATEDPGAQNRAPGSGSPSPGSSEGASGPGGGG